MHNYLNHFLGNLDIVNCQEVKKNFFFFENSANSFIIRDGFNLDFCFAYVFFQVCEFLEVSTISFSSEYGPKLREGYVLVKHLGSLSKDETEIGCFPCKWFGFRFCNKNWKKVISQWENIPKARSLMWYKRSKFVQKLYILYIYLQYKN